MGKDCDHNDILLKRNGTDQNQRSITALDPNAVKLHDFSVEDWMAFAHAFAGEVNYFNTDTNTTDGENWQAFFIAKDKIKDLLSSARTNKDLDPHLTLFVCFLSLIEFSQNRLNNLTKRHLDFYYKEVLNLRHTEAKPDKVHVLFELAKNASEVKVDKLTALDGGKDGLGNKRIYKTVEELIVNKAKVADLKNVFHEDGKGVKYSEIANSMDGLGEPFHDNAVKWWPFGHPTLETEKDVPNLPDAKLGFAIASPILVLKEGIRTITFTFDFETRLKKDFSKESFDEALEVILSGEKEWIPATINTNSSFLTDKKMMLTVELSAGADAIVPYNKEVLLENFNSNNPIARFLFTSEADGLGYQLYTILKNNKLKKISIDVQVQEMQELILENDLGRLDASKPFLPFGPQPVKGSKLYIGCQEALNKPWTKISIDLGWKDTPFYGEGIPNFVEHYKAYRYDYLTNLGKQTYTLTTDDSGDELDGGRIVKNDTDFKVDIETLNDKNWEPKIPENEGVLFEKNDESYRSLFVIEQPQESRMTATSKSSSSKKAKPTIFDEVKGFSKKTTEKIKGDINTLFGNTFLDFQKGIMGGTQLLFDNAIQQENFSSTAKKGFIRLSLRQSFFHELYPKIYAIALSKEEDKNALIPNQPYTPLVETLRIAYSASVSKHFDLDASSNSVKGNLADYLDESLELFHEHPFGQSEEHTYLKSKHDFLNDVGCVLVPDHDKGELYVALEGAAQLQQVTLLVQVLEGSENPEYEGVNTFQGNEKLEWAILSNDEWKPLNQDFILSNGTDNFLKSGIVSISIPKEATKNNNRLPGDFFWLKIRNEKKFDTVCQAVSINTQVTQAEFENNNNEVSHLATGLPAETIAKLVERIATLKGISQPHSSFGGVPKETDAKFYRRVSERLRHKQRAITICDYEHLILQYFPDIYKVNCLKHTLGNSSLSPGNVTVLVIPNIVDQNVFDSFKPRISKAKRNEIQVFVNKLNTLHVDALLENPLYQEVKVALKVKFYTGKDGNFYSKELQKDIAKFLAPWAYEETAEINFGITLHKSIIIFYIEKLGYVDYIKDFELLIATDRTDVNGAVVFESVNKVMPENAKTILTSVKPEQHKVEVIGIAECATM